jgi:hypothetical protein
MQKPLVEVEVEQILCQMEGWGLPTRQRLANEQVSQLESKGEPIGELRELTR